VPNAWEIRPFEGIGPLRFGQARDDVRALLGPPTRGFRKVPFAATEADAFIELGLHVYFSPEYRVETVDAVAPSTATLHGLSFLGRPVEDVVQEMEEFGLRHHSFQFDDAGVGLYEEDGVVRCVTVYPRGCFDLSNPDSPASRALAAAAAWKARYSSG
jgi:hypothetical protein